MQTQSSSRKDTVDHLNSFLRGELSAVETYRQALKKLDAFAHRATLEQCARSHEQRVQLLSEEVRRLGGDPAKGSGTWGSFAQLVEGGATLLGDKAAIAALEEGEDHGKADYRRDLGSLDGEARLFVESRVLPEQIRTHDAMSTLKKSLS
jgi:demethoxyubiquinone hydroxylase (CLK1/Coq7/Cat5 family)